MVAVVLQQAGMGTLLFDLLTPEEDAVYANRFDIDLLTERLIAVTEWASHADETENLDIGYFGASTGAASALNAAAALGEAIKAVVSRGGRPDLSMPVLHKVVSPVLLIVGGLDGPVIGMNKSAFEKLHCEKALRIVEGATHLFAEPGKLEEVARLSIGWFDYHFT
jgi:dienelactone hydrolase